MRASIITALVALAAFAVLLPPLRAAAQVGIAYVEAPERSSATCTAANPERAFACARERCAVRGVKAGECMRLAWCFPAGWSVLVFTQNRDGFHGHRFTCGLESRELALKVAALQCDRADKPYLAECGATELFDPEGRSQTP
jgi:hypothetical protein